MNVDQITNEIGAISTQMVDLEAQLDQLKKLRQERVYLLGVVQRGSRDQGQVRGDSSGDQPEKTE